MTDAEPASGSLPRRRILTIFIGLLLGMAMAAMDQTIVATALPSIVAEVGGVEQLSWIVTSYLLAMSVTTPIYGKLGDIYGRKRLFQVAIVVFLAGSVACASATSMGMVILFRAIQGAGAGGLVVLGQAIIADVVSPRERGSYQGLMGAVYGGATVSGPLLGGFFTDHFTWRWIFYVNLPLGIGALVVTRAVVPPSPSRPNTKLDFAGGLLLSAAIVSALLALTWGGNEYEWGSTTIVGLFVLSFLLALGFLFAERRAVDPMLPLHLFKLRTFTLVSAIGVFASVGFYSVISFLPLFMETVNGVSSTLSGTLLTPLMISWVGGSVIAGTTVSRTGRYRRFPLTGSVFLVVGLFLLSTLDGASSLWQVSAYMIVCGIGAGFIMPVILIAIQNVVPSEHLGVATSAVSFFRAMGGAVGVAITGAIFNAQWPRSLAPEEIANLPGPLQTIALNDFADALATAYFWLAPAAIVAFACALAMREVPLRTRVHAQIETA